jgi:hypothetical protein
VLNNEILNIEKFVRTRKPLYGSDIRDMLVAPQRHKKVPKESFKESSSKWTDTLQLPWIEIQKHNKYLFDVELSKRAMTGGFYRSLIDFTLLSESRDQRHWFYPLGKPCRAGFPTGNSPKVFDFRKILTKWLLRILVLAKKVSERPLKRITGLINWLRGLEIISGANADTAHFVHRKNVLPKCMWNYVPYAFA